MLSKITFLSFVGASMLLAMSDEWWKNIIAGVVALALGWMTMKTKAAADSAHAAAIKAVVVSQGNEAEIKEVKVLATTAVKQGNSTALTQLELYEVLAKQLAHKSDATQQDIELHQRAVKAIAVHKEMQRKVDEEAQQVRADERIVAQTTVANAVKVAVDDAVKKNVT